MHDEIWPEDIATLKKIILKMLFCDFFQKGKPSLGMMLTRVQTKV